MEASVAAELHRLIDGDRGASDHSEDDESAYNSGSSDAEGAGSERSEGSFAESEDDDSEDHNDEFDDMDDANEADADGAAEQDIASSSGNDSQLPTPPERGGQSEAMKRGPGQHPKHSNAQDLRATGVARAAARLLQQDTPADGLGILSKSKSVAKRQAEEAADTKADRAAKRLRLEMKHRGHEVVPKRGENPQHDAAEKALLKLATRGVVRLFNAVSKAQRDQKDALVGGSRSKVAKLDKASFLAELRGMGPKGGAPLPAGTGPATAAAPVVAPAQGQAQISPAWDVLSEGFGLQGGAKMKDWDKEDDSDAEIPGEALHGVSDSDSD